MIDEVVITFNTWNAIAGVDETVIYSFDWGTLTWVKRWGSSQNAVGFREWVMPQIASATIPGAPASPVGLFHMRATTPDSPSAGTMLTSDMYSTDGGVTWTLAHRSVVGGSFLPAPINAGTCYAGDYEGLAADPHYAKSFSSWGRPVPGSSPNPYAISGNTVDL